MSKFQNGQLVLVTRYLHRCSCGTVEEGYVEINVNEFFSLFLFIGLNWLFIFIVKTRLIDAEDASKDYNDN